MGLFINKDVRGSLDKGKVVTSYVITALCALLIAINIGAFLFFPRIASPIAIILSNAITLLLMLFAVQPIANLLQNEFSKKANALVEEQQKERELQEKVATLENRNRELESRIDTWSQTANAPTNVNLSFKLETMTYDKTGYIVKEEPLEKFLTDPVYKIADKKALSDKLSKFVDNLTHPGEKKVLYIGKYYVKASIGLDFTKVKFANDNGVLTLFGVKFSKLNDLAIERDPEDVNRCWLINDNGDEVSINQADVYRDFTEVYSKMRTQEADKALEGEVEGLCERYTAVFRNNLSARFPGIRFCDQIEDSTVTWYSLKETFRDERAAQVAANMLLMADALSGYTENTSGPMLLK
ncbi:MAG: hypothetical protein J5693_05400 [Bacteroidales bacterium]|nr:hypothetical protein [Bacteroidales bacterium]